MMFFTAYLLIATLALVTGFSSGLFGIGGNVIAIPLLTIIFHKYFFIENAFAIKLAIANAMVVMLFTSLSATLKHWRLNNIALGFYKQVAIVMIIGNLVGANCVNLVNGLLLKKVFAIFLIIVSLYLAIKNYTDSISSKNIFTQDDGSSQAPQPLTNRWRYLLGFIIGFKSGLLGIGGGTILIPWLLHLRYRARQISGTTSLCTLTMALAGSLTFFLHGIYDLFIAKHSILAHTSYMLSSQPPQTMLTNLANMHYRIGYLDLPVIILMAPLTFVGAKFGVQLTTKLPHKVLINIFVVLVFMLGMTTLLV